MEENISNGKVDQGEIITIKLYSEDDIFEEDDFQPVSVGISSVIGTRKSQQDSVFGQFDEGTGIAIVCDGMGGLRGGEKASQMAVQRLASDFFKEQEIQNIPEFFRKEAYQLDQEVGMLCDENGDLLEAGTTLVSVIIKESKLYWLSVGDSKIYIIRDNEIMCVNRLHNYRMTMDEMMKQGQLTMEEYREREKQAEALISYIGMRDISLMDVNPRGFPLKDNDMILLTSDGLYRLLSDDDIFNILKRNMFDMKRAANALTEEATRRGKKSQDNTSVAVIRFLEEIK